MKKIKVEEKVKIITGKDKGKVGAVLKIKGDYVTVQGANIRTKAAKKGSTDGVNFLKSESWIHISNVSFVEKEKKLENKKAVRV